MSKSSKAFDNLEEKVQTAFENANGGEEKGTAENENNSFYDAAYVQDESQNLSPDATAEDSLDAQTEQTNSSSGDNGAAPPLQNDGGLILGKFKTVNDLIDAYRNSERFISKTRQELKDVKEQYGKVNAAEAANAQTSQVNADNVVQVGSGGLQPYTSQNPGDNEGISGQKSLEEAAVLSLMRMLAEKAAPPESKNEKSLMPTPEIIDKLMADEGFVEKYILSNPKVTGMVAKDMLRSLKDNEPPNVISRSGGAQLSMPQNRPKTFEEAGNAFKKMLEKMNAN